MKTKTLSLLCIFALLSVNLVTSSVIKKGLEQNPSLQNRLAAMNKDKKNLVETGAEQVVIGEDCEDAITGVPPLSGAVDIVGSQNGVLASVGS